MLIAKLTIEYLLTITDTHNTENVHNYSYPVHREYTQSLESTLATTTTKMGIIL